MADNFQLKAIISAVDKITPTLRGINTAIRGTRKALRDIGRAGGELMGKIGLPVGLSLGALVYGVKAATTSILNYGGAVQDASEKTGVHTEALQAMRYQASLAGMTAEDLDEAMVKLNKGLAEAAAGKDKSFAELMKKMNIPLRDAKGNIISVADAMPLIANAFEKTTDPALRTRMAMELFSKAGAKLIPWLKEGKGGFYAMMVEARRLGIVISESSIKAMDDLGDEIGTVGQQIRGQWGEIMGEIAPLIKPLISDLKEWIAANKELIRAEVGSTIRDMATWLRAIDWGKVRADIAGVWTAISGFVDAVGGMRNVMIGLGVAFLAGPLAALLSIGAAVGRLGILFGKLGLQALAWLVPLNYGAIFGTLAAWIGKVALAVRGLTVAMLASPWGIVIAAVAALGLIIYNNWDKIVGYVTEAWARIKGVFEKDWFSGLLQFWLEVWQGFGNSIVGIIKSLVPDFLMPEALKNFQFEFASKRAAEAGAPSAAGALPAAANRPPTPLTGALQAAAGRTNLQGDMTVRFENAPPGMRVEQGRTNQPGVGFNPDVGYRSFAIGAP